MSRGLLERHHIPHVPTNPRILPRIGRYETNKFREREKIENGWIVAYGRELTETDFLEGTLDTIFGGAAGFLAWINRIIDESITQLSDDVRDKFDNEVREEAIQFSLEVLEHLIEGKDTGDSTKRIGSIRLMAGVAKYTGENQVRNPLNGNWETVTTTLSYQPYIGLLRI